MSSARGELVHLRLVREARLDRTEASHSRPVGGLLVYAPTA